MIDTKALRQKVLDLAIRGKLVPQNPNDESTSVLLERIRVQKQQMVKEGKLKAKDIRNDTIIFVGEDNLHYEKFADGNVKCIEDEIPFEVPEGWVWCTLSMIGTTNIGLTYSPSNICAEGTMVLRSNNIVNGKINLEDLVRVNSIIRNNQFLCENDIIICARNGSKNLIGKCAIFENICEVATFGAFMTVFRSPIFKYIYYFMNSKLFRSSFANDDTKQINQLTQSIIKRALVPVPPLEEQNRITEKLDLLFGILDNIDNEQKELLSLLSYVKSKILDLAICGKLVPQDPDDEPASFFLERIRSEKDKQINRGKLKRNKKEYIIFKGEDNSYYEKMGTEMRCIDDEIPFTVPHNWMWCRLQNCCCKDIKRGKAPKYSDSGNVLVFAQKCNTKSNGVNMNLAMYLDESTIARYTEDEFLQDEDIVINSTGTGTLGRVGFYRKFETDQPAVPDSHVTIIRTYKQMLSQYIFAFLKANQQSIEDMGEGSTNQKELKPISLINLLVPLPPLNEQKRIISILDTVFDRLDAIEASLN